MSTEIIKKQPISSIVPSVPLNDVIDRKRQIDTYIQGGLKKDQDFGVIPGTHKPTLLKPGAEQVLSWFNCYPEFSIMSEFHNDVQGIHRYAINCVIINRSTGEKVGNGIGSCSGNEKKYKLDRNGNPRNEDLDNTILKMAKKRALVDAVLTTFALSDRFTQDMEREEEGEIKAVPSPVRQPTPDPHHTSPSSSALDAQDVKKELSQLLIDTFGANGSDLTDAIEMLSEWRMDGIVKKRGVTDLGQLSYEVKPGKKMSQAQVMLNNAKKLCKDANEAFDKLAEWRANRG